MNPYQATNGFYVNLDTQAARWVKQQPVSPDRWRIISRIAQQPTAIWIGPGDVSWLTAHLKAAAAQNKLPVLSAYAIPNRDLGQHSAGGTTNTLAYMQWATRLAKTISNQPAVLILETDTLIHMNSLTETQRLERCAALNHAIHTLGRHAPNTWVYLDGGDGHWTTPTTLAHWLLRAGVAGARGFAVNVANYNTTDECAKHAAGIRTELAKAGLTDVGYIIDTSRNGNGPNAAREWCNPTGRKLGVTPTIDNPHGADALLWVKLPGESDGNCGIGAGTRSGEFSPRLALALIAGQ